MSNQQRTGVSPVRAALAQVDQATRPREERVVLTHDDVPGKPLFWRVVLQPYIAKYDGLLEQPELVKRAEEIASCVGQVLAIGSMAFKSKTNAGLLLSDEPHIPKVGESYAGIEVKLKGKESRKLRVINETEILMVIDRPDDIRGYL